MEWVLQLASLEDWPSEEEYHYQRLYFGSEFCQNRIPSLEQVTTAWGKARSHGWSFTLVTPYVTEKGLKELEQILMMLENEETGESCERMEVVVNDWGVFQLLTTRFPQYKPVIGRLLQKMLRDPRLMKGEQQTDLGSCNLTNPWFKEFLVKRGIERVEFDNLLQGVDLDLAELGFKGSLYVPFGCITTGRACLPGSLNRPPKDKFRGVGRCGQECRQVSFTLDPGDYLVQGNTVFYRQDDSQVAKGLALGELTGIDRAIYQPYPPV